MVREIFYIVYDDKTMVINDTFPYYTKKLHNLIQQDNLQYINVTHPITKNILDEINTVNDTDYK